MKKLLFFLGLFFWTQTFFANPVSKDLAKKVAENWYSYRTGKGVVAVLNSEEYRHNNIKALYIFNFEQGGFVIVSADDDAIPVLGYSLHGTASLETPNIAFLDLLKNYARQIEFIQNKKLTNPKSKKMWQDFVKNIFPKGGKSVSPLMTTTWDQLSPYNYYCPSGTPTGCVSTSISQIMKYWAWPPQGDFQHSFIHPKYGLQSADFGKTTYNWSDMPNSGDDDNHDVARLMYHMGVAVDMDYSQDGSGSQVYYLAYVLPNYFKYDQRIKFVMKSDYTDAQWITMLEAELDAGRPVEYAGFSSSSGGHAFVIDGYDDSDNFHINWGWSGYEDGYYAIGALNPSTYDFNDGNQALINIKPSANPSFLAVNKQIPYNTIVGGYPMTSYIQGVNTNVAWAIANDASGRNNYRVYAKTIDGGLSWEVKQLSDGTDFSMIYGLNADTAFIAAYGSSQNTNHILKTVDGGETWTSVLTGGHSASFFNVVHFFNNKEGFVQGDPDSDFEIYTTSDCGENWTRVDGADIPGPLNGEYGIVGHYCAVGDTAWFTTNKGRIFRSTDKGHTWQVFNVLNINPDDTTYIKVAFDKTGKIGLAGVNYHHGTTDNYLYKTTDGGETWTKIVDMEVNDISAVPGKADAFYIVGNGIYYTEDAGATISLLADYYSVFNISCVDAVSNKKVYFGEMMSGYHGGAWIKGDLLPLVPRFNVSSDDICINGTITIRDSSLGEIVSYKWNFGDGATPATATTEGPFNVTYSTEGYKTITLTITDTGNVTMSKSLVDYVRVAPQAPSEITEIKGDEIVAPKTKHTYSIVPEDYSSYFWETEGDGLTLNQEEGNEVDVTFPEQGGKFFLKVRASNGCGETGYTEKEILSLSEDVQVWPVPALTTMNIGSKTNIKKIELFDAQGRKVLDLEPNTNFQTIDVTKFEGGIYVLRLTTETGENTAKITIK